MNHMKEICLGVFMLGLAVGMSSCKTIHNYKEYTDFVVEGGKAPEGAKRELVYEKALDYTFLVVLDAIDQLEQWDLTSTDKRAGKVTMINNNYSDPLNSDNRTITLFVERLEAKKTLVRLDRASQAVFGAEKVLDAIDLRMHQTLKQAV